MGTGTGLNTGPAVVLLGQGLKAPGRLQCCPGTWAELQGEATDGIDQGHQGLLVPTGPSVIQIIFSQSAHKTVL